MAFDLKLNLKLSQQLVMTPQLQQAIKLLQMSRAELSEVINQELVENPVLDEQNAEGDSTPEDPQSTGETHEGEVTEAAPGSSTEATPTEKKDDDFNWDAYLEEFSHSAHTTVPMREMGEDLPTFDAVLTKTESLEEHLEWQLSMTQLTDPETKLGTLIIGNLSEDGYLIAPLEDLAKESGLDPDEAEEVLKLIQNFDPIAVGSRDLKECLLIQARFLTPPQPLVETMISNHLSELERKNYGAIARALNLPLEDIIAATKVILEFEPRPGRSFSASDAQYITPDVWVYKVGDEFTIVLNEEGMPKLKISPYYKNILAEGKAANNKVTREYVQDKLRSALWLIRSIHNRQRTIYKVVEAIVSRQRDFFDKGVQCLKPMILKDVAQDIGMHESTVSRVTSNKYVHTPVGIFELKYFFNSSIQSADGGDSLASEAVKDKLRALVSKEDPREPLSDQRLVELLKHENIVIARRTVAKYRDILGILSSSKRKKVF